MSNVTIIVSDERTSVNLPVGHNGRIVTIPVGVPFEVDEGILGSLSNSSIPFTVVGEGGGSEGGVLAEPPSTLAILDQPIPTIKEAAKGMDAATLQTLIDAEEAGKTRTTLIAALETLLAAQTGEKE